MLIATFRLHQVMRSTELWSSFLPLPAWSCSLSGPLLYRSPVVVVFDRGHPRFGWTSYVESFLDPMCVPVSLYQSRLPCSKVNSFWSLGRALKWRRSGYRWVEYLVVLLDRFMHRSPSFGDVNFTPFTGNPINHAISLVRVDSILRSRQVCCRTSKRRLYLAVVGNGEVPSIIPWHKAWQNRFELCRGLYSAGLLPGLSNLLQKS